MNVPALLDKVLLGQKLAGRGLNYRPLGLAPVGPAKEPTSADLMMQGRGLQYQPMSPLRGLAAGGLRGVGQALMAWGSGRPELIGQAFSGGLDASNQNQARREAQARNDELFGMQIEEHQETKAERKRKLDAEAKSKAEFEAAVDSLVTSGAIDESEAAAMKAGVGKYGDFAQKPKGPESSLAKLKADLDAGLIDEATYQAAVRKENYIAPAGGGLTERQRNARDAGLIPGTREYQQFILGRDDNEGGGPFEGNSMDAQASNILLTGDPASPEYAAAHAYLAQPKVQFDPTTNKLVTVSPDLSWATRPGRTADDGPAVTLAPIAGTNRLGVGGPGPTVQNAQALPPAVQELLEPETFQVPGATITSTPGTGLSAGDRTKLRTVKAEAQSIRDALTRFKDVVKSSDWLDDASAATGGFTEGGRKLNSAWTNAAIMTKAEALFNLGVLNGPDLSVIQGTLPNPSTMSGLFTSEAAAAAAVDEVLSLIDSKVAAYESQFGRGADAPSAPTGLSGGRRVDQLPPGNWQ
jgi:hypothetical protein